MAEFSDVASGKDDGRPGFRAALARRRQLGAVLAAARLDRITRLGYGLAIDEMHELGVYIRPRSVEETDRLFAGPGLFVVNPDHKMRAIDI